MLRIVLPVIVSAGAVANLIVAVLAVVVIYVIVVDVDIHVVVAPTSPIAATSTPGCSHRDSNAERDRQPRGVVTSWWVNNRRIRIDWRPINHGRVVARHIDDSGLRLLDHDHLICFRRSWSRLSVVRSIQLARILRLSCASAARHP